MSETEVQVSKQKVSVKRSNQKQGTLKGTTAKFTKAQLRQRRAQENIEERTRPSRTPKPVVAAAVYEALYTEHADFMAQSKNRIVGKNHSRNGKRNGNSGKTPCRFRVVAQGAPSYMDLKSSVQPTSFLDVPSSFAPFDQN